MDILVLDDNRNTLEQVNLQEYDSPEHNATFVKTAEEFFQEVRSYYSKHNKLPDLISFDHDLHPEHYNEKMYDENPNVYVTYLFENCTQKSGYHCVYWLFSYSLSLGINLCDVDLRIHTMNPAMQVILKTFIDSFLVFSKLEKEQQLKK